MMMIVWDDGNEHEDDLETRSYYYNDGKTYVGI